MTVEHLLVRLWSQHRAMVAGLPDLDSKIAAAMLRHAAPEELPAIRAERENRTAKANELMVVIGKIERFSPGSDIDPSLEELNHESAAHEFGYDSAGTLVIKVA